MDGKVIYSRCSVGKGKWFWVVKTKDDYFTGTDPFAFGYARSAEQAEAMATGKARECFPGSELDQVQGYTAEHFKRCLLAREKAKKLSDATSTAQVEYLYRDSMSDYDCSWSSTPHRIVKKTKKKVFVYKEPSYRQMMGKFQYGDWRDFAEQRTFVLDRLELEREGRVWSRTMRDFFYTTPCEERRREYVPECGKLLGLVAPWTTEQVKRAFRPLVKKAHPDAGGDSEEFKRLYLAYEQALEMAVDKMAE